MLKLRFLIFGLILCPFLSFSQNDFFKGYMVKLNGDTLVGYILGKEIGSTLSQVQFKSSTNAAVQRFSVEDCIAFGLYDRDSYERHTVNVSQGEVNLGKLSTGIDTTSKRVTVFLRVLQNGKNLKLYTYVDNIKPRFYVKEENEKEPVELMFYSFYDVNNGSQIINNPKYQTQLLLLSRKYGAQIEEFKLERVLYNENDIVKVVSLINHYRKEKSKYRPFTFYVGGGVSSLATKYDGEHALAKSTATSKNAVVPFVNVGMDIYINPAYARTFFRIDAEVGVLNSEHSIENKETTPVITENKHDFKQFSGTLSVSLLRNLYSSDKQKVYLGLGIAMRYADTKDNIKTFRYSSMYNESPGLDFKKISLQIPISAGVILFKKLDASFTYVLPSTISDNYVAYGIKLNKLKLGINYRF